MNGNDLVEHIERCEYCQGLDDAKIAQNAIDVTNKQIQHLAEGN